MILMLRLLLALVLPPVLTVTTPTMHAAPTYKYDTMVQYDTMPRILATTLDASGRKLTTSVITWTVVPASAGKVLLSDTKHHTVRFTTTGLANAWLVASWKRTDKSILRDSVLIRVVRPPVATLALFNRFVRSGDSTVGIWDSTYMSFDTVTKTGTAMCVYVVGRDIHNRLATGTSYTLASSNTAVTRIDTVGTHAAFPWGTGTYTCPDTTIDPAKIPYPTPQPPKVIPLPAARRRSGALE